MVGRPDRVFTFLLILVLVWLCGILGFLYHSRHSDDSLSERHFQSLYGGPQVCDAYVDVHVHVHLHGHLHLQHACHVHQHVHDEYT